MKDQIHSAEDTVEFIPIVSNGLAFTKESGSSSSLKINLISVLMILLQKKKLSQVGRPGFKSLSFLILFHVCLMLGDRENDTST